MSETPFLDKYTENLTEKISKKLESFEVIGRDLEIKEVLNALTRIRKNSPILVGDAGGENSYCRGIDCTYSQTRSPLFLKNVVVRNLELSSLLSEEDEIRS
ncbi:MAG: hypothetical protein MUW51_11275 [Lactococcus lactis]|nr:hypothetical protein [Lactococcus lactis]